MWSLLLLFTSLVLWLRICAFSNKFHNFHGSSLYFSIYLFNLSLFCRYSGEEFENLFIQRFTDNICFKWKSIKSTRITHSKLRPSPLVSHGEFWCSSSVSAFLKQDSKIRKNLFSCMNHSYVYIFCWILYHWVLSVKINLHNKVGLIHKVWLILLRFVKKDDSVPQNRNTNNYLQSKLNTLWT